MRDYRFGLKALPLVGLVAMSIGCSNNGLDAITVSPTTETVTLCGAGVSGPPVQMTATGVYNHGSHPATTKNITNLVTWSSDITDIATVSSTGLAQVTTSSNGVTGNALITASAQGGEGPLSASATFTKSQSTATGCAAVEPSTPREGEKL